VLERVVATSEGVAHVEVDVAHRGDLAGAFDVTVTPTVVVLDAHGVPVGRVEGAPSLAQARATLTALLARPDRSEPDPDPEPEPVRRARVVVPSAGGAGRAVGA
ncbi:MAG TPA: thioredoxin, partial [Cellulomonas sp.]